jgi:hypothetical protein
MDCGGLLWSKFLVNVKARRSLKIGPRPSGPGFVDPCSMRVSSLRVCFHWSSTDNVSLGGGVSEQPTATIADIN